MDLDPELCWRAVRARDRRFDGRFFTCVRSTGVYCRPVCPAPTPKRENCEFLACAAAAQEAGFRPCLRCRPEAAPGTPAWLGSSATVSRALRLIAESPTEPVRVEDLAARLGIGGRQLRRLFSRHLGASPAAIARTRRVHFARRLIDETRLPMGEVALASGFRSIRQFNHAVRATFGRSPTRLRRGAAQASPDGAAGEVVLRLPYRPPFDWESLLGFLALRALPGVECVDEHAYRRVVEIDGDAGWLEVRSDPRAAQLVLRLRLSDLRHAFAMVQRVRRLFDLDADPLRIATDLGRDPDLARLVAARPGVRVPGAWDPFELTVRAVLGQQVSVKGATTLAGRLVQTFGKPVETTGSQGLTHRFPRADELADADLSGIGLPRARAATVRALAGAVASGELSLEGPGSLNAMEELRSIEGVGDWTAQYVAMRALNEPDAFPAGDLGLRRAVSHVDRIVTAAALARRAEAWRPWRAYAAMWLWTSGHPPPA